MNRHDKARKLARALAHQSRKDNRQPDHPLTADQRRDAARDERRAFRKAA